MQKLELAFNFIFSEWYRAAIFFFIFFSVMYFAGAAITENWVKFLARKGKVFAIQHHYKKGQKRAEIKRSLLSIFIFSLQAIPLQWLIKHGFFQVSFENYYAAIWQIPLLFLWNEVHFYAIHRLLHTSWFFKNVHYDHHLSKEPTVYSVYSFHWLEAFLLGTVIFFPLIFFKLNIFSVLSLPVFSIVLNLIGHCNHDSHWVGHEQELRHFAFRHSMHHQFSNANFGFMLPFLDQIFHTNQKK